MSELVFDCVGAAADRDAVGPTIMFRLQVAETTGEAVHAIALRAQIRIEPVKRRYSDAEAERLVDLFGERSRWGDTMKPLQLANVAQMVPAFTGSVEVDVPVALTYDLHVATAKYFHGLDAGEIPFILLFSGTVFLRGEAGFSVEQIPWEKEARYRLPVAVWREAMDVHFPDTGWIRVRRDTLDALSRFKSRLAVPTWDDAFEALLRHGPQAAPGGANGARPAPEPTAERRP